MGKAFETDKHGYRIKDVDAFIAETNEAAAGLRERISELKKELSEKDAELKSFKQKQDLIVKSIVSAVQKAEQIENLIKQKYAGEMAHLSAFHEEWLGYYNRLIEVYPLDGELSGLNRFNRRVSAILGGDDEPEKKFEQARRQFESERERLNSASGYGDAAGGGKAGQGQSRQAGRQADGQSDTPSDNAKQKKKYIGFIPVGNTAEDEAEDGEGDFTFNPEESIRQMLRRQAAEEERKAARAAQRNNAAQKPAQRASRLAAGKKSVPPNKQTLQADKSISKSAQSPMQNASAKAAQNIPQRPTGKKPPVAATVSPSSLGASDSGFSFEEALNPTQHLTDILKELGLELTEK